MSVPPSTAERADRVRKSWTNLPLRLTRRPSLVVAGSLRPAPLRQGRSARPMRVRCAGEIRPMRLLPRVRLGVIQRRRDIHAVMQPAMPGRRYLGGLDEPIVDHPPALESENRIDLAATGAV